MEHFIGIDVSLEPSSVCVLDAAGGVVREAKVPSEPEALVRFTAELDVPVVLRPRVRWDTSDGLFDEPVEVTRWTTLRAERSRARRSKHLRLWAGSGG